MSNSLIAMLETAFSAAIARVAGAGAAETPAAIQPSRDPRFGDYQCNAAMALAKRLGAKPRDVAERIAAAAAPLLAEVAGPLEVAGAGFINIRLRDDYLARGLAEIAPPADARADRVGIGPSSAPRVVLIDYSSPNIAKQMHVGHLRSTIIGDVFARVLAFEGHTVIRQNHIGDWGTAIGMVVLGLWYIRTRAARGETFEQVEGRLRELQRLRAALDEARRSRDDARIAAAAAAIDPLGESVCREWSADLANAELDRFAGADATLEQLELGYRFVQGLVAAAEGRGWRVTDRGGSADEIAEIPRKVTRMLQVGGPENAAERQAWEQARRISLRYCGEIYARLGVLLTEDDVRGESFYESGERLPKVVAELRAKLPPQPKQTPAAGPYVEFRTDQGAACLFFYDAQHAARFKAPDGAELPMIVQKSDGAFLYATTDLAAIRFRIEELGARRLIYVTDARQKLHFQMFFAAAVAMGWACHEVTLEHVTFGSILGEDRKPLKTRAGENVKLLDLLDEAERRARALLEARLAEDDAEYRASFSEEEKQAIARRIGIGAVKYFDLARDRNGDYAFSWDHMLALQGNTAPYMLYAYARIRSIYRKAAAAVGDAGAAGGGIAARVYAPDVAVRIGDPAERALALRLARLPEAIDAVAAELLPHTLCTYVYDLAADFMRFYEACPVVQSPDEVTRLSRMRLCDLTARSLRLALGLLGIEVIERM